MQLATMLVGHRYQFRDVKDVLAKANGDKSGDQLAGIAAGSPAERMAARYVLSELSLETLRHNPAVPYQDDEVARVIDDAVNESVYREVKDLRVGELRDWLLADSTSESMIKRVSTALTAEMVAAVTKLMSNLDLMLAASKIRVIKHCNNTIGLPGTLATRCQPNHQTASVEGNRSRSQAPSGTAPPAGGAAPTERSSHRRPGRFGRAATGASGSTPRPPGARRHRCTRGTGPRRGRSRRVRAALPSRRRSPAW